MGAVLSAGFEKGQMKEIIPSIVGGIVRAALAAGGGSLVVSESDTNQIIGGLSILVTVIWTVIQKKRAVKE